MTPRLIPGLSLGLLAAALQPARASAECVGKVLLPAVEAQRSERVEVAPGRAERVWSAPRVERRTRRVLLAPAERRVVRWAALYRTERRWVAEPGPVRWRRGPDRWTTVVTRELVQPGHYVWRRQGGPVVSAPPGPGQTIVSPTGLVLCRVWCPAIYREVARPVRIGPGRPVAERSLVRHEETRQVLVRPAGQAVRLTPARYGYEVESRTLSPGRWTLRQLPARYEWRTWSVTREGGYGYAPVVCGGPLTRGATARMQSALAAQGYDPGPVDGWGRPQTFEALHRFQADHRMAQGQVTVESARALGVLP